MKIKLNKREIIGIVLAIPHIFDFDYFPTLSGFSLKEVNETISKIQKVIFSEDFVFDDSFEVDLNDKDLRIIFQIVAQTKSLVKWKEDIFFLGEVINFEELTERFRPFKMTS